ncbi:MAG: hypothetical protein ACXV7E_05545 [Methylobacter sp.]
MKKYFLLFSGILSPKIFILKKQSLLKPPLTIEDQKEIRIAYSNYFTSLMAAIEILLEKSYRHHQDFRIELFGALAFDGKSGEDCYNYLRELRNSIVHRGYDISSAATFIDDLPVLIAPPEVPNLKRNKWYGTFGKSILEVIERVEAVIGDVILEHAKRKQLFKPTYSDIEKKQIIIEVIPRIPHMPQWAKEMSVNAFDSIDFGEMVNIQSTKLEEILTYKPLSKLAKTAK